MGQTSAASIRLRPVTKEDLPALFEHQRDPLASRMAAFPPRNRGEFMAHWNKILRDADCTTLVIQDGPALAGSLFCFTREGRRVVGYWIDREFWGRGIATAALRQFLALETRRPLYAEVAQTSAASIRVLEKCGFSKVEDRKNVSIRDAAPVDEYLFELS